MIRDGQIHDDVSNVGRAGLTKTSETNSAYHIYVCSLGHIVCSGYRLLQGLIESVLPWYQSERL
jgi:hypothetical protein